MDTPVPHWTQLSLSFYKMSFRNSSSHLNLSYSPHSRRSTIFPCKGDPQYPPDKEVSGEEQPQMTQQSHPTSQYFCVHGCVKVKISVLKADFTKPSGSAYLLTATMTERSHSPGRTHIPAACLLLATVLHKLLQCRFPMSSQILPANLLQQRLLPPQACRSCQDSAPAQVSHGFTATFRHPPASVWGPALAAGRHTLCCWHLRVAGQLPHHGLHYGLQGNLCSVPVHGTPPIFHWPCSLQGYFSHRFSLFSPAPGNSTVPPLTLSL